jgi:hypothetical protein
MLAWSRNVDLWKYLFSQESLTKTLFIPRKNKDVTIEK